MPDPGAVLNLRSEVLEELTGRILPFWMNHTVDERDGGFYGRITHDGKVVEDASKGAILNARILWTFSAAGRLLGNSAYRPFADRAFNYIREHFLDRRFDGVYWSVDAGGNRLDDRKHIYAQAFVLYGVSEYYTWTGLRDALKLAQRLFELIEKHAYDPVYGGYFEAFTRDWARMNDVRLSEKDLNFPKSMNTHLHVMEAYTTLYRVWADPLLKERLQNLTYLFLDRIIDPQTGHVGTFFDEDWTLRSDKISFGHDIETAWLLLETADILGVPALRNRVVETLVTIASATLREGVDEDGGLFNETSPTGRLDSDKHWWPQAEALVGFLTAYRESGNPDFFSAALASWDFIKNHVVDYEKGEWFNRLSRDRNPYPNEDKVGFWKCPYHNGRACLEVMSRLSDIAP
jgi:mannobiose 2-epimerase